jgi:HAD superfamily hydrolase (TIGR01490 family)
VASAPALSAAAAALALFDLDGTLLDGDTDQLWCEFLMSEGVLDRAGFAAKHRSIAERYAAGSVAPAEFCAFYAALLAGRSVAQWKPQRERFVAGVIVPRLGAAARALVAAHRAVGDELVLTTATNRFLAEPIARLLEIPASNLIATELEEEEGGRFTGGNRDVLNMGAGKVVRLQAWLAAQGRPETALAAATFYSDSSHDLPLLRAVGRAVVVDPDARLRAEAERVGWPVLRLPRASA